MVSKAKKIILKLCNLLELCMGAIVLFGLVCSIFCMLPAIHSLLNPILPFHELSAFLGTVAEIVIGIEFLKMLCEPQAETIIEVIIFMIARHMIIAETSSLENLLAVISIGMLFAMRKYLE